MLQFNQIIGEFGNVIPWLEPLQNIAFYTNAKHFEDRLLMGLRCDNREDITPIQFVTSDESQEYVGGMIRFTKSPEKFTDFRNLEVQESLEQKGHNFVSCIQMRKEHRSKGYTNLLMKETLSNLLTTYKGVWGVVTDPLLLRWYISLGGILRSPMKNLDNLWIISWE